MTLLKNTDDQSKNMVNRMTLTAEIARQLFAYNAETGELRWNAKFAGRVAGSTARDGYRMVSFGGRGYRVHRVSWLIVHGEWPKFIDHINGNRADNRLVNLRSVEKVENQRNQKIHRTNTSGFVGVSWVPSISKWQAYITENGKPKCLGRFRDINAAVTARRQAERDLGYHPNHGRKAA